jgi:hypothetical protein
MGGVFIVAINQLKSRLRMLQASDLLIARLMFTSLRRLYIFLSCLRKFIIVKDYRRLQLLKVFKARSIHQTTTVTFLNRYPKVFLHVRSILRERKTYEYYHSAVQPERKLCH